MQIVVSGVHSGPNPSPGLGVARSLREAYPSARLIANDYSNESSGLHSTIFDGVLIQPPWAFLDFDAYMSRIEEELNKTDAWIPCLDLEVRWLAERVAGASRILVPPLRSLAAVRKPQISAHSRLPVRLPSYIRADCPADELHQFCREHGWRVWLKGPDYEAFRIRSWVDYEAAQGWLEDTWGHEKTFLQAHVTGYEQSIAFAAYAGRLLDAVHMEKHSLTGEGKTWAGSVKDVLPRFLGPLRDAVAELNWTGGAELECVVDSQGEWWLFDWNPRFPAWIYGATICGRNLPGALVEAASGLPAVASAPLARQFIRVVHELPVRSGILLSKLSESRLTTHGWSGKHPSDMPSLSRRVRNAKLSVTKPAEEQSLPQRADLELPVAQGPTPQRIFLSSFAERSFRAASEAADAASAAAALAVRLAYSLKTDSSPAVVGAARAAGFLAEAISLEEYQFARRSGWKPGEIIVNGPAKAEVLAKEWRYYFCDSVEELLATQSLPTQRPGIGIRLRPPFVTSRFGIPLSDYSEFDRLVDALRLLPADTFVVHYHIASSWLGVEAWFRVFKSMLKWSAQLASCVGRRVSALDVGGGWAPAEFRSRFLPQLPTLAVLALKELPGLQEFILEPGKALAEEAYALQCAVVEKRLSKGEVTEIIVDAGINQIPEATTRPLRVLFRHRSQGVWLPFGQGNSRILGRICMETDILARRILIPRDLQVGDFVAFLGAGAYNQSMAYEFGRGSRAS